MGFKQFLGNAATVRHLREAVRADRFPHSLILAGPKGAGKYTLSLMLAKAVNCLDPTESDGLPDFAVFAATAPALAMPPTLKNAWPRPWRRATTCAKPTRKKRASSSRRILTC